MIMILVYLIDNLFYLNIHIIKIGLPSYTKMLIISILKISSLYLSGLMAGSTMCIAAITAPTFKSTSPADSVRHMTASEKFARRLNAPLSTTWLVVQLLLFLLTINYIVLLCFMLSVSTMGVTFTKNVVIGKKWSKTNPNSVIASEFRKELHDWTFWHYVRTVCSMTTFLLYTIYM